MNSSEGSKGTASPPLVSRYGAPLSPHNSALLEVGKSMMFGSVTDFRSFCRFMAGISAGALPVYLGLLQYASLSNPYQSSFATVFRWVPQLLFGLAMLSFIFGSLPKVIRFSLDVPHQIDDARRLAMSQSRQRAIVGLIIFLIGLLWSSIVVFDAMNHRLSPSPNQAIDLAVAAARPPQVMADVMCTEAFQGGGHPRRGLL